MRPRGESISSPHSTYVGQVGRQKPQCTQSPISAASGGWCSSKAPPGAGMPRSTGATMLPVSPRWAWSVISDASYEPPRREPVVRVELVLDAAHQVEAVYRPPHVDGLLHLGRTVHHHDAALVPGAHVAQPRQRLRYVVRATQRGVQDTAAGRAPHGGADLAGGRHHVAHTGQHAGELETGLARPPRVAPPTGRRLVGDRG